MVARVCDVLTLGGMAQGRGIEALVQAGILQPGLKVLRAERKGRVLYGDLLSCSRIRYSADNTPQTKCELFTSPTGFANHCCRLLDSAFQHGNGFSLVYYSSDLGEQWLPLDYFRSQLAGRGVGAGKIRQMSRRGACGVKQTPSTPVKAKQTPVKASQLVRAAASARPACAADFDESDSRDAGSKQLSEQAGGRDEGGEEEPCVPSMEDARGSQSGEGAPRESSRRIGRSRRGDSDDSGSCDELGGEGEEGWQREDEDEAMEGVAEVNADGVGPERRLGEVHEKMTRGDPSSVVGAMEHGGARCGKEGECDEAAGDEGAGARGVEEDRHGDIRTVSHSIVPASSGAPVTKRMRRSVCSLDASYSPGDLGAFLLSSFP